MGRKYKEFEGVAKEQSLDRVGPIIWSLERPVEREDGIEATLCYAAKRLNRDETSLMRRMTFTLDKEKIKCKNAFTHVNELRIIARRKNEAIHELNSLLEITFKQYGYKMSFDEKNAEILSFFENDPECERLIKKVVYLDALLRISEQPDTLEKIKAGYNKEYF